jgi:hypothetical protein
VRKEAGEEWLREYQRSVQNQIQGAGTFGRVGLLSQIYNREQREANYATSRGLDPTLQLRQGNEAQEALRELQQARREMFNEIKEVGATFREWTQGISEGFGLLERKQGTFERIIRDAIRR